MVSDTGDIPERDEVEPDGSARNIAEDVLGGGEVIVTLQDGNKLELHSHDTYFYDDGYVYTRADPNDVWFHDNDIVQVIRHYE